MVTAPAKGLSVKSQWAVRLEHFGGLAFDLTGRSRFLRLNVDAAVILELCRVAPRREAELVGRFGPRAGDALRDLRARGVFEHRGPSLPVRASELAGIRERIRELRDDCLSAPFELNVYTTSRCNLDCSFCYLSLETRSSGGPKRMGRETVRALAQQCVEMGVFAITFLGGEPFIDQEAIAETLDLVSGRVAVQVTTNGTIAPSARLMERLVESDTIVMVSVHSSDPAVHDRVVRKQGAWAKAMETVRRLNESGLRTIIQCVVTRENTEDDIMALMSLAQELGAMGFFLNQLFPGSHMTREEYAALAMPPERLHPIASRLNSLRASLGDSFYVYPKGTYEFAYRDRPPARESEFDDIATTPSDGVTGLEVFSDGNVFAGLLDLNEAGEPIANLEHLSLQAIWDSPRLDAVRRLRRTLHEPCSSCVHREFCKGGNPKVSLMFTGRSTGGDLRCPIVWNHLIPERADRRGPLLGAPLEQSP